MTTIAKPIESGLVTSLARGLAFALLMALSAQAVIPVPGTPVPVTLQVFALFAGALAMGPVEIGLGMVIYLLLGRMGFGVFAHGTAFSGLGATMGYVTGMLVAAPIVSLLKEHSDVWAGIAGLFMIYLAGAGFLCVFMHISFIHALAIGVLPFMAPDFIKLGLAIAVARKLN